MRKILKKVKIVDATHNFERNIRTFLFLPVIRLLLQMGTELLAPSLTSQGAE